MYTPNKASRPREVAAEAASASPPVPNAIDTGSPISTSRAPGGIELAPAKTASSGSPASATTPIAHSRPTNRDATISREVTWLVNNNSIVPRAFSPVSDPANNAGVSTRATVIAQNSVKVKKNDHSPDGRYCGSNHRQIHHTSPISMTTAHEAGATSQRATCGHQPRSARRHSRPTSGPNSRSIIPLNMKVNLPPATRTSATRYDILWAAAEPLIRLFRLCDAKVFSGVAWASAARRRRIFVVISTPSGCLR